MSEPENIPRAELRRSYTVPDEQEGAWRQDLVAGAARLVDVQIIAGTRPAGDGVELSILPVVLVHRDDWAAVTYGASLDRLDRVLARLGGRLTAERSAARVRWHVGSGDDPAARVDVQIEHGPWPGRFSIAGGVADMSERLWALTVSPALAFCSVEAWSQVFDDLREDDVGAMPWDDYLKATDRLLNIGVAPSEAIACLIDDMKWPTDPLGVISRDGWRKTPPE